MSQRNVPTRFTELTRALEIGRALQPLSFRRDSWRATPCTGRSHIRFDNNEWISLLPFFFPWEPFWNKRSRESAFFLVFFFGRGRGGMSETFKDSEKTSYRIMRSEWLSRVARFQTKKTTLLLEKTLDSFKFHKRMRNTSIKWWIWDKNNQSVLNPLLCYTASSLTLRFWHRNASDWWRRAKNHGKEEEERSPFPAFFLYRERNGWERGSSRPLYPPSCRARLLGSRVTRILCTGNSAMQLWMREGFHSYLIPDNSREAATARLPWAPEIFHARVSGFGQVFRWPARKASGLANATSW